MPLAKAAVAEDVHGLRGSAPELAVVKNHSCPVVNISVTVRKNVVGVPVRKGVAALSPETLAQEGFKFRSHPGIPQLNLVKPPGATLAGRLPLPRWVGSDRGGDNQLVVDTAAQR